MDATSMNQGLSIPYDASGNIGYDGVNTYLYDGEGRICAVQQVVTGLLTLMTQYLYDADGNRVAKGQISTWSCDTTSNGFVAQTVYVLGPHGEQMTELSWGTVPGTQTAGWQMAHTNVFASGLDATYDADMSNQTEGALYFHLSDWLGTRRQQTDSAGNPCLNFTGQPYGDGLTTIPVSNTGCPDATEHHFTGKERDTESGLDYMEARYYGSSMGRMMSPDPVFISIDRIRDPQGLNLYAYARNNPLSITDPTGLDFYQTCTSTKDNGDTCQQVQNGSSKVWVQGTSDSNGFTANRIANDADGNLVDTAHGNAAVSGSFDENGVHLNGAQGQFIDGSAQTNVNGSGIFSGIQGQFVSDCGGSCQGRAELVGSDQALSAMEGALNRQGGLTSALDLLSGAHNPGTQWKDSDGYIHVILNGDGTLNAGKTEMHFEGHPTGVDVTKFVLHMVDTIRDATSGRAAAEKSRVLP
jgi:RHS repeat-associated protein